VGNLDKSVWTSRQRRSRTIFIEMRTSVGSEYYLRHLRSSACGTRLRAGPHSWRRFAFFEDNSPALAELPSLAYVCGGGPKRKQEDTLPSQYGSLIDSFCQRTQRNWLEEIGDGHCGIRCLWRQFDEVGTASIDSGHIRNGREKLASALRTHSSSIVKVLVQKYGGDGGITVDEIEDRAKLHERLIRFAIRLIMLVDFILWILSLGQWKLTKRYI